MFSRGQHAHEDYTATVVDPRADRMSILAEALCALRVEPNTLPAGAREWFARESRKLMTTPKKEMFALIGRKS